MAVASSADTILVQFPRLKSRFVMRRTSLFFGLYIYISARQYIPYRYTVAIASSADTILVQFPQLKSRFVINA